MSCTEPALLSSLALERSLVLCLGAAVLALTAWIYWPGINGPELLDDQASRRLQIAAEKGHSWAIAFRPLAARRQPSAAALRLELHPGDKGSRVHILKSRGGRPAVVNTLL